MNCIIKKKKKKELFFNMRKEIDCFKKNVPSVFVISSPFQVLCAYEAIQELDIRDYSIIAVYDDGDPRTKQLFSVLDYFGLVYQKFSNYPHVWTCELLKSTSWFGFPIKRKVKRAFVGDFRNIVCIELAFACLNRNSSLIYLDDGNATINHLEGLHRFNRKESCFFIALRMIAFFRKIDMGSVYYTIFSDIPSIFFCKQNALNSLRTNVSAISKNGIYFIGTNSEGYCDDQNLSLKQYFNCLENVLKTFKENHPKTECYYVFHGRDLHVEETNAILDKCGFCALRLNEIVEMYFVRNKIHPEAVAGFMSSALYTIKLISPDADIVSFMQEGNLSYAGICSYYQKNGIKIKYFKKE